MFRNPQFIYTIPLMLVFLTLLYVNSRRERKRRIRSLSNIGELKGPHRNHCVIRSRLKATFIILGLICLMVAIARPQLGFEWKEQPKTKRNLLIVLDISRSMLVEDVYPNRLERAKFLIQEIIEGEPTTSIGLLVFAGDGFLQCPITEDHRSLLETLSEQSPDLLKQQGSDIARVLLMLPEVLENPDKDTVILLSDGEDHSQQLSKALQFLRNQNIRVHTICVGTEKGGLIPNRNSAVATEPYFYDKSGNVVYSKANPLRLQYIAREMGGSFEHFQSENYSIRRIHEMLNELVPTEKPELGKKKIPVDYYQVPLLVAFILLCLDLAMGTRKPDSTPQAEQS